MNTEEIEEFKKRIFDRIPKGWGYWISCDSGWFDLIDDLDKKISYLAPNYEIHQVKEKYGTLRFYVGGPANSKEAAEIIDDLISYAQHLSSVICEVCGAARYGRIRTRYDDSVKTRGTGWYKTLCNDCAIKLEYPTDEEMGDEE